MTQDKNVNLVKIKIELFGTARMLTRKKNILINVPINTTLTTILSETLNQCPELSENIISIKPIKLRKSYTMNLNGYSYLENEKLKIKPNDSILLIPSQSGG
ncbi:MAG: hypothetical protein CL766_00100 [Chloroflexi bacterium]|jgi:molybdopterin converting factor small subunit|nr:hypothetical protein [Chloroflexota bacterium]|tara:strand:- start:17221 stop:17526 length:306 start_codon:yes stop_codon:yes gene_type:complete